MLNKKLYQFTIYSLRDKRRNNKNIGSAVPTELGGNIIIDQDAAMFTAGNIHEDLFYI